MAEPNESAAGRAAPQDERSNTPDRWLQAPGASFFVTLGTAILIGILGLILFPLTVGVWDGEWFEDDDVELFAGVAVTIATVGVVLGDAAFARYIWRAGLRLFCATSQIVIVGIWLFAFAAALVAY